MNKKRIRVLYFILLIILAALILLFFVRLFSPKHLDDVSPNISCDESLLQKADYLAVVPLFDNQSIADNSQWCEKILSLNKSLVMHGVYHSYNEFAEDRNEEYISLGKEAFQKCFGFAPTMFKPPQLAISENNKKILEKDFRVFGKFAQLTHKSYHCGDSGMFPNWLIDLF
jgi:predicted deacetylase